VITDGNDRLAYKLVLERKLTAQQIADLLQVSISTVNRARRQVAKEPQPPPTDDEKVSVRFQRNGCLMSLLCTAVLQAICVPDQNSCESEGPVGASTVALSGIGTSIHPPSAFDVAQARADMKQAVQAARSNMAKAAAKWPDISAEVWRRLSPDGWCNANVTGGPPAAVLPSGVRLGCQATCVGSSTRTSGNHVVPDCGLTVSLRRHCHLPLVRSLAARELVHELLSYAAGAKQSKNGLRVTVQWPDGVSKLLPYEALRLHVHTSNALLDFMVARVRRKKDLGKQTASVRRK